MPIPQVTIKYLDGSRVEITGELATDAFEKYRKHAMLHLGESVKIDGFRQGHIPESILTERLGEAVILEEMANDALGEIYPSIIAEHKLEVIGRPDVSITKIARGNPLCFVITTSVLPEIALPDYKKIAAKAKKAIDDTPIEVTDKDIEETLKELQRHKLGSTNAEAEHAHKHEGAEPGSLASSAEPEARLPKTAAEKELPPIDDEFAKSLGKFENLEELKTKLRENMKLEKESARARDRRNKMVEAIMAEVQVTLPIVLVEREIERMMEDVKNEAANYNIPFEEYLKVGKKTEEGLRAEWKPVAEKRVLGQLILRTIGKKEQVKVSEAAITTELEKVLTMYPAASKDAARLYIEEQLAIEQILQTLESFS
ncbi:MAG: hypothetical protein A2542_02315 [Parcubacteria group bacterium RIFOXYD2_FULL_52_8]|nr:MAG: hypothetical protein A2542_02315 [Parcubacteria group bacterium RIFOXYD2_FULL_52_8]